MERQRDHYKNKQNTDSQLRDGLQCASLHLFAHTARRGIVNLDVKPKATPTCQYFEFAL